MKLSVSLSLCWLPETWNYFFLLRLVRRQNRLTYFTRRKMKNSVFYSYNGCVMLTVGVGILTKLISSTIALYQ